MSFKTLLKPYSPPTSNFVDCLRYWAEHKPDDDAFAYLDSDGSVTHWSYGTLDRKATAIAARLADLNLAGQPVALVYPPGLDFVAGFFACLYAEAIAVPAVPPRRNRKLARLETIVRDCGAKAALTTGDQLHRTQDCLNKHDLLKQIRWVPTDSIEEDDYEVLLYPEPQSDQLAMLQYTSGSTGNPKGVMLSHGNLIHNSACIIEAFRPNRQDIGLSWLPTYHDMGLVGGILMPILLGRPNVLMSPMAFLQEPARWLRAVSRHGIAISGGPDFAWRLCVEKVADEELHELDLSSWRIAFNGAEPVRQETLSRFVDKFSCCGFRAEAFYPCYGMAETTLFVAGRGPDRSPTTTAFNTESLGKNEAVAASGPETPPSRELVSCGRTYGGQKVAICEPNSSRFLRPGQVGEIVVQGKSVAHGYWNNPAATRRVFGHSPDKQRRFVRTGDLGFVHDRQLYITGRVKDLIIIRGTNLYAQDLEQTAERTDSRLIPAGSAAFPIERDGTERLILVCETRRSSADDWPEMIRNIRRAVADEFEVTPEAIVLVRAGTLPRTSSGKMQRYACLEAWRTGKLKSIASWRAGREPVAQPDTVPATINLSVVRTVIEQTKAVAGERARLVTLDASLVTDIGLDSVERFQICSRLEATFGGTIPEQVILEAETCRDLAVAVETHMGGAPAPSREIPREHYDFAAMPEYLRLQSSIGLIREHELANPYFTPHQRVTRDTALVDGHECVSFSTYNYLGMSGDPVVSQAACDAIARFGTSVSASRLVAGEKTLHVELERAIAGFLGTENALVFVGGHATNETAIGHLFGPGDLILYDELAHNSIVQGAVLSGARRQSFPHNDWRQLDRILTATRRDFRRVLVAIEGVYSMDGDFPDLPRFVEAKQRHKALLLIDEAHSIGTMGPTGRGIGEHFQLPRGDVDLWMGTLSKSLGSCGGYIAGRGELIELLKYTAPGFVYSVGISPANTAAALASLQQLEREPQRVTRLQRNARLFLELARSRGLDTGMSRESPVIPVIIGSSVKTMQLSSDLFHRGISVHPIVYPAVDESAARLRFFVTACHRESQIRHAVNAVSEVLGSGASRRAA